MVRRRAYVRGSEQARSAGKVTTTMSNGPQKPWMVTLLLCLFVGTLGAHRFYVGKTGSGVAQLLTLGGCGLWALYDLVMILTNKFVDAEGRPLLKE